MTPREIIAKAWAMTKKEKLLKKDDAGLLRLAYLCFRSKIHRLNLQKEPSQIPLGQFNSLRAGVFAIWKQLFAT